MKTSIITNMALVAIISMTINCGAIENAGKDIASSIEGVGDGIESKIDDIENRIDEILRDHAGIGSDADSETDDTVAVEEANDMVFVSSYTEAANTCASRYNWPSTAKLFSDIEDNKLGTNTLLTDLAGDWEVSGETDSDTETVVMSVQGNSAIDVIDCACDFDSNGFTCHCDGETDCAVVYIIK